MKMGIQPRFPQQFPASVTSSSGLLLLAAQMTIGCALLAGLEDETVPESVDKRAILPRLAGAAGPCTTTAFVEHGVHDLTGCEEEYVRLVTDFLAKL